MTPEEARNQILDLGEIPYPGSREILKIIQAQRQQAAEEAAKAERERVLLTMEKLVHVRSCTCLHAFEKAIKEGAPTE